MNRAKEEQGQEVVNEINILFTQMYKHFVHTNKLMVSFIRSSFVHYLDKLKSPAFWKTDFAIQNNSCEKTISLTFELPPAVFEFQAIHIVRLKMDEFFGRFEFADGDYNIVREMIF